MRDGDRDIQNDMPRLAIWGTYDTGKPRVRMLIEAARCLDPDMSVAGENPWNGIDDKSQISGVLAKLKIMAAWMICYPRLLLAYLRMPPHDIVIVPYLGNLDVLLIWPLARLRGSKICWDMFISLYDTVVEDRKLVRENGLRARLLYFMERLSIGAADLVLLDTRDHARYVASLYQVPERKVLSVFVGAETELFTKSPLPVRSGDVRVLFYGQFIPLHGLETLIRAIAIIQSQTPAQAISFTLIGTGQEAPRIDSLIEELGLNSVTRVNWVGYADLPQAIAEADICLGVFGGEGKAARVIPNKVFQILSVGRPTVTRDGPAIRELLTASKAIRLVEADDPAALAHEITRLAHDLRDPAIAPDLVDEASKMPSVGVDTVMTQLRSCLGTIR